MEVADTMTLYHYIIQHKSPKNQDIHLQNHNTIITPNKLIPKIIYNLAHVQIFPIVPKCLL